MDNPFRYSGPIVQEDPLSGSTFIRRYKIVSAIDAFLQKGEYVQVVGPHRSGRTTLAIDLIDRFISKDSLQQKVIPVRISCESLMDSNSQGFILSMVTRLRRVLDESVPIDKCQKIKSILLSEEKYPKTFLDLHLLLVEIGDELQKAKEYSHFVFLLDEIEAMPDKLVKDVLCFFRGLFSHYERRWKSPYRVIIFTIHDLAYWKLGRSSPYNISNVIRLTPFSQEEFNTMLDDQHVGKVLQTMTFDKYARNMIMVESGGFPYFIQRLCHILVEKYQLKINKKVTIGGTEVHKAVLRIFEKGDDNLENIYSEVSLESNEWQLCRKLAAGHKETYFANNPAINKLAELGITVDVEGYCQISTGLYERQILKIYFDQEYQRVIESFSDDEQLLFNISCLQGILLNGKIEQIILIRIEYLKQDKNRTEEEIAPELLDYLDRELEEHKLDLDMEEINTYIDYYKIKPIENREKVLSILIKAFIGRFNENNTTE